MKNVKCKMISKTGYASASRGYIDVPCAIIPALKRKYGGDDKVK